MKNRPTLYTTAAAAAATTTISNNNNNTKHLSKSRVSKKKNWFKALYNVFHNSNFPTSTPL